MKHEEVPTMSGGLDEMTLAHAALQGMQQPLLVIDRLCQPRLRNPAAREVIGRGDVLDQRNGRITCSDPASGRRLIRALNDVLEGQAPCRALQLTSTASGEHTSASVRALSGNPASPPLAVLTLFHADAEALASSFALTPAEARIAAQLMLGLTAKSIAQQLGIAVSTVRSHTQDLFYKTGAHRQADLVRRLLLASTL